MFWKPLSILTPVTGLRQPIPHVWYKQSGRGEGECQKRSTEKSFRCPRGSTGMLDRHVYFFCSSLAPHNYFLLSPTNTCYRLWVCLWKKIKLYMQRTSVGVTVLVHCMSYLIMYLFWKLRYFDWGSKAFTWNWESKLVQRCLIKMLLIHSDFSVIFSPCIHGLSSCSKVNLHHAVSLFRYAKLWISQWFCYPCVLHLWRMKIQKDTK